MSGQPPPYQAPVEEQLRVLNGSVGRLLILAMDQAKEIGDVKADLREVKAESGKSAGT